MNFLSNITNLVNPNKFLDPNKLINAAANLATGGAPAWVQAFAAASERLTKGDFFGGLSAMANAVKSSPLEDTQKKQILSQIDELVQAGKAAGVKSPGGQSLLMQIAMTLGKLMDEKMQDVLKTAKELGKADSKSSQYGELSARIDATNKELDFLQKGLKSALDALAKPKDIMQ